jgi:transcriptional regulator GlxA family with amidase domain
MAPHRRIVILGFSGAQSLDLVGPLEVFHTAERLGAGRYSTEVVAPGGRPFATSSRLTLTPDRSTEACRGPIDTLVVAGGTGVRAAESDPGLMRWLERSSRRSRRIASVCTGAFLLAGAGLLDGRRATTHWASAERLAAEHPSVRVEPDRIFVRDGDVWSSAGVTAGMDLALALVEDDHGREAALEVARWLVVFATRPGGQSQFSAPLAAQSAERGPLRAVQEWVLGDPARDCTVETLAARACMSPRNFSRAFRAETGLTPAAWVETVRVERARQLLEAAGTSTEAIAAECGFGTVETLRRAFRRRLGVSPGEYRERFRAASRQAA